MSTPLFDSDEEMNEYEEESVEISPLKIKFDKIFNNDYNVGNLDYEDFGTPKVEKTYADKHMESYYNSSEYHARMEIMEVIDVFFSQSEIGKTIGLKKKIPKQMLSKIYLLLKDAFKPNELSEADYFTSVADYFGMSYEILYSNIPAIYREYIVKEMDDKYSILKRRGLKKLF